MTIEKKRKEKRRGKNEKDETPRREHISTHNKIKSNFMNLASLSMTHQEQQL